MKVAQDAPVIQALQDIDEIPIPCPTCNSHLGRVVEHEDKPHFDDGVSLILVGQRRCHKCGTVYRWHGNRQRFEDLVANYIQRMEAAV